MPTHIPEDKIRIMLEAAYRMGKYQDWGGTGNDARHQAGRSRLPATVLDRQSPRWSYGGVAGM